jgi:hypothetical protein
MFRKFSRAGHCALLAGLFAAQPIAAQTLADRLSIHGYLTQAYAISDSHQVVGIPHGGTFDYRRAALLFRFKGTPNDAFVVQLASRELGDSPIDALTSEVQLDWAFYERRFGSKTTLRIGKAPIPMGIFNGTRYVGTLLPFYRAPIGFYQEGTFTGETLNGLVLMREITPESRWKLSGSLYGGGYEYLQAGTVLIPGGPPPMYTVTAAKVKNLVGAQFWLQTPLTGLRVGLGGEHRDDYGVFDGNTSDTHASKDWWASVDGNFDRFSARGEYRNYALNAGQIHARTYYGQIGFRILDDLTVNAQRDVMDLRFGLPTSDLHIPYGRDNAIGVNYQFAPNIVGKFELHDAHGLSAEEPLDVLGGNGVQNNYLIASLSVSF